MSAPRYINPEHVLLTLVALRAKSLNPALARFAAISNGTVGTSCRWRTGRKQSDAPRTPPMFYPLLPSVTPTLVKRTRMTYGLQEVKRTWSMGYKAMLTEVGGR